MQDQRKTAAILYTDIVKFGALMSKDREWALKLLDRNRDFLKPIIEKHNGEWLKEIEDSTISCFSTSEEAVNCALEIQRTLKDEIELRLRIGIHFGNVVCSKGAVFGTAVDVASSIEPLVEPGGIGISEHVYYDVRNVPDINAEFLGEKRLKNVDHPVKVYSLKTDRVPATSATPYTEEQIEAIERKFRHRQWTTFAAIVVAVLFVVYSVFIRQTAKETIDIIDVPTTVTDTVRIAVLPFNDVSSQKDQEYFCDGIALSIIDALSPLQGLLVIDPASAFSFKGTNAGAKEIGEKLNVEFILQGDLLKESNLLRILVRLIRVADGAQIWSERYEKELKEIFLFRMTYPFQ